MSKRLKKKKKTKETNQNKSRVQYEINVRALFFATLAWCLFCGMLICLLFSPLESYEDYIMCFVGIFLFFKIAVTQTSQVKVRSYRNSQPKLHIDISPDEILNDPKKVAISAFDNIGMLSRQTRDNPMQIMKITETELNKEITFSLDSIRYFIPLKDYFKLDSLKHFKPDLLFEAASEMVNKKSEYIEEYYYLAQMYELGIHVVQNKEKALELYRQALRCHKVRACGTHQFKINFLNDIQTNIQERIANLTKEIL